MKVFIDTNVILDRVLFRDEPNFSSAKIFEASATGKIDGYIAALSFSHIAYILRKRFSLDEIREMYMPREIVILLILRTVCNTNALRI